VGMVNGADNKDEKEEGLHSQLAPINPCQRDSYRLTLVNRGKSHAGDTKIF